MAQVTYCKSCGAYIPEWRKKCLACGFPVEIPSLTDSKSENLCGHSGGKPIIYIDEDNVSEGFKIGVDGYELNERGEILSAPNEGFGTTTQYDPVLNLEASLYDKAQQEQADIDLDALMDMRFFTVKIGGVVSKYYFGDYPKTTLFPMDEIGLGRTIHGRIIYGNTCGAKRIIDLKLIER